MSNRSNGIKDQKSRAQRASQPEQHGVSSEKATNAVATTVDPSPTEIAEQFSNNSTGIELEAVTKPGGNARDLGVSGNSRTNQEAVRDAYRTDVEKISFEIKDGGLFINLTQGPYGSGYAGKKLTGFKLTYDPTQFTWPSLARRAFGSKPLELGMDDIRLVGSTHILGKSGEFFEVFLKNVKNPSQRDTDDGPLLMISRDTGRVIIYPALGNSFFKEFMGGLAAETQQKLGHQFVGSWKAS